MKDEIKRERTVTMRSCTWYVGMILILIASPFAFATVVPDGGENQDEFGGGSGSGGEAVQRIGCCILG